MDYLENRKIFLRYLKQNIYNKELIFLCVGSNNIIGDMVGPLVGTFLKKENLFTVIGDIYNPITAKKLSEYNLKEKLKNKYIVVIDAAMGKKETIGKVFISNNPLYFGKALDKEIESIGDISIKGCVCENYNNSIKNYNELKKVDINLVIEISRIIIKIIS